MWDWAVWGALIAGGLAGIGAVGLLARQLREAVRAFKAARERAVDRLDDFVGKAETTAEKAAAAGDAAELQESVARLRVSLARLAVLRDALDEAGDAFGRLTAFVPRG